MAEGAKNGLGAGWDAVSGGRVAGDLIAGDESDQVGLQSGHHGGEAVCCGDRVGAGEQLVDRGCS